MISRHFYKENQLISAFLGGTVQHYPIKERYIVVSTYDYEVQAFDTMYSLAKRLFGDDQEFQWVIIADINFLREPDDLQPGETIKLPKVILSELRFDTVNYAKTPSATTKI